jgi:hypothetical protein
VLALFLVRPQAGLLHRRIAGLLSSELGRPVEIASVHIRFLPRPALELRDVAIHDSAQFGAEPLVYSPEVTAELRISSLLRGRLEISGLNLNNASLNLARSREGFWNLAELLQRASRSSTAPTGAGRKETRREFPYIEASEARINFKDGLEKTHFALTNADLSLWQESETEWGVRLRARPIRTDRNLTDAGEIRLDGFWQKSVEPENTPVQLAVEWRQAQIGQVSEFFTGNDSGWRGSLRFAGTLGGTLGHLRLAADAGVDELRRGNVLSRGDFSMAARCTAEFGSAQRALRQLDCNAPAGDGWVELKGEASGIPFSAYDLTLIAKDVPAQSALQLARQIRAGLPTDLDVTGTLNMSVWLRRPDSNAGPQLAGEGDAIGVRLSSSTTGAQLALARIPFAITAGKPGAAHSKPAMLWLSPKVEIGPIRAGLGKSFPITAELELSRTGYNGWIRGESSLSGLQKAAGVLHIPMVAVRADGSATVNLVLAHNWGEATRAITGTAQLRSVRAQIWGLNAPVEIRRADITIGADSVRVSDIEASAADTMWRGLVTLPRPCATPQTCPFEFRLRSAHVSAASLNRLLNPAAARHPWYRLLDLGNSSSFFGRTNATGSITVDKLALGGVECSGFSAVVGLQNARLILANVRGKLAGGSGSGVLRADFSAQPPAYSGTGQFEGMSLAAVSELMHTQWAEGSGSAKYQFRAEGRSLEELLQSAEVNATFNVHDGMFPHIWLANGAEPLRARTFSGRLLLQTGTVEFDDAKLNNGDTGFAISGTATIGGALNLKMTGDDSREYLVSGTLQQTRVSPLATPPTQAALKR